MFERISVFSKNAIPCSAGGSLLIKGFLLTLMAISHISLARETSRGPLSDLLKPNCESILIAASNIKSKIRWEFDQPLSSEVLNQIRNHPISTLNDSYSKADRKFHFIMNQLSRLENDLIMDIGRGEGRQSLMIMKYLIEIFPNASFLDEEGLTLIGSVDSSKSMAIDIHIRDQAEQGSGRMAPNWMALEMPMLKLANPGLWSRKEASLRDELHLPEKTRVLSLYARTVDELGEDILPGASLIEHNDQLSQLTFVSLNSIFIPPAAVRAIELSLGKSFLLSELLNGDEEVETMNSILQQDGGKVAVINDMNNQLLRLHATADLAMISGPINFIEPLTVGTPTHLFLSTEMTYDFTALEPNIEIAKRTGGFEVSFNLPAASTKSLSQNLLGTQPVNPAFVARPDIGSSSFTGMLDQLYEVIHRQYLLKR